MTATDYYEFRRFRQCRFPDYLGHRSAREGNHMVDARFMEDRLKLALGFAEQIFADFNLATIL